MSRTGESPYRTFTPLDADTWDVLVEHSTEDVADGWSVRMSNQQLGDVLGMNRRLASVRAKRLIDFGMVKAVYSEIGGRPQSKVYLISSEWLGSSPVVGDYYPWEEAR
jgi:hypothetical protein